MPTRAQRVWVEYSQRHVEPDVEVVQSARSPRKRARGGGDWPWPSLTSCRPAGRHGRDHRARPFKESFLEIRRRRGKEIQIVTSIEILSPVQQEDRQPRARKVPRKAARNALGSETHLVEIDLLRGGAYTLAVPKDLVMARPARSSTWSRSIASIDPRIPGLSDLSTSATPPDRHPPLAGRPRRASRPPGCLRPILRFWPLSAGDRVRQGSDRASLETGPGRMGRQPAQAATSTCMIGHADRTAQARLIDRRLGRSHREASAPAPRSAGDNAPSRPEAAA